MNTKNIKNTKNTKNIKISQIDRDYGFDENDVIESNESFVTAMKEIERRDILNNAATKLELLAQAIRDENKELFDDLTQHSHYWGAYFQGIGIVANVDLDEVHDAIFGVYDGNRNSNY